MDRVSSQAHRWQQPHNASSGTQLQHCMGGSYGLLAFLHASLSLITCLLTSFLSAQALQANYSFDNSGKQACGARDQVSGIGGVRGLHADRRCAQWPV